MAKHTPELAQLVVGAGGVGALVDYVGATKGNTRLPGIMALGYIAAFSETLGLSVIAEKGLVSHITPHPHCHVPGPVLLHSGNITLAIVHALHSSLSSVMSFVPYIVHSIDVWNWHLDTGAIGSCPLFEEAEGHMNSRTACTLG